jgi:hypothetical protein
MRVAARAETRAEWGWKKADQKAVARVCSLVDNLADLKVPT